VGRLGARAPSPRVQLQAAWSHTAAELVAYGGSNAGAVTPWPPAQHSSQTPVFFSKGLFYSA